MASLEDQKFKLTVAFCKVKLNMIILIKLKWPKIKEAFQEKDKQ